MKDRFYRERLIARARYFVSLARKGAGFDGDGNFGFQIILDALAAGITFEKIGITKEKFEELKKINEKSKKT